MPLAWVRRRVKTLPSTRIRGKLARKVFTMEKNKVLSSPKCSKIWNRLPPPTSSASSPLGAKVTPKRWRALTSLVYGELHHRLAQVYLAGERPRHLLQPTALVNEAFVRSDGVAARPVAEPGAVLRRVSHPDAPNPGAVRPGTPIAEAGRRCLARLAVGSRRCGRAARRYRPGGPGRGARPTRKARPPSGPRHYSDPNYSEF